jgi:hypothetical protein
MAIWSGAALLVARTAGGAEPEAIDKAQREAVGIGGKGPQCENLEDGGLSGAFELETSHEIGIDDLVRCPPNSRSSWFVHHGKISRTATD